MSRATKVLPLFLCLLLTAGCSGSDSDGSGGSKPDTSAGADGSTPEPTEEKSPLAGMSARQVWKKTKADAADAKSVHVVARLLEGKEKIAINLVMTDSGKASGTISSDGEKMAVRRLGKKLYFKADRKFWTENGDAATAEIFANRWIMVKKGASADMDDMFDLTDMDWMVGDTLAITPADQKRLKRVPGIDIGEQSTVGLADKSANLKKGDLDKLYVSDTDPALPLNFSMYKDKSQYMRFRDWNKSVKIVAPKDFIDLAAMTG